MIAFGAGVLVWAFGTAIYLGLACVTCWGYVGHWPANPWVATLGAAIFAFQHGAKVTKEMWDR